MKKELDQALTKDFPTVFRNRHASIMESCMGWGFECGSGWEPIIRKAAAQLEELNKALPENMLAEASQIKEKYGTLRFYIRGGSIEADDIVHEAEQESETTCETCGAPGKLRGTGWYYTACDAHTKDTE